MAPEGQACATSTTRSTGMASGWIHVPFTLPTNTCGVQVTQKREWMQRFASKVSSSFSPRTRSIPSEPPPAGAESAAAADGAVVFAAALTGAATAAGATAAPVADAAG